MRNITYNTISALALILALLLTGCGKRVGGQRMLAVADSLANANPDSAVVYLNNIKGAVSKMSKEENWRYRLLCIKAADKASIKHKSDVDIMKIVGHYEKASNKVMLPTAYYYAGCVYRDLGQTEEAQKYYYKALELVKDNKNTDIYRLCNAQIGMIFLYGDMPEDAIPLFHESFVYDSIAKDTMGVIYDLRDIGNCYNFLKRYDIALSYYKRALYYSEELGDEKLEAYVNSQLAWVLSEIGRYNEAKSFLGKAMSVNARGDRSAVFSIALDLYEKIGLDDSAVFFSNLLLKEGNVYGKKSAHEYLAIYYDSILIDRDKSNYHKIQEDILDDSIKKIGRQGEIVAKHKDFEYQGILEDTEQKSYKIAVIFIAIVLIGMFSFIVLKKQKRIKTYGKTFDENDRGTVPESSDKTVECVQGGSDITQDAMNTCVNSYFNSKRGSVISVLKKYREANKKAFNQFASMGIYNTINYKMSEGVNCKGLSKSEWDELDNAVNTMFPEFKKKLLSRANIDVNNYRICLLIKIALRMVDISNLTLTSKQNLNNIRKKLYKTCLGKEGTPSEFDNFIRSL